MNIIVKRFIFGLIFFFVVFKGVVLAEAPPLIFSTPPTQSPEITLKNYQPLVDYISQGINRKIILEPAESFQEYTKKMRAGRYDMVFDGPHFINWRMHNQQHVVVARQPGELHFAIIVKDDSRYSKLRDIWTLPVCSPSVPHLGTLTLLELYSNPIREPVIVPVQSFKKGLECLREGRGIAALVRDKYWFKKADQSGLRVLYITKRKMPARGLTVNNRVSKKSQKIITQMLTSEKGRRFSEKAFSTIGGGKFVTAKAADFRNLDETLKMVWGFHE